MTHASRGRRLLAALAQSTIIGAIIAGPVHAACTVPEGRAAASLTQAASGEMAGFRLAVAPLDVSDFAFLDEDGKARTLADWKGRTVLFNLWATWCAPCRAEMPHLDALQRDHGGEDFEVMTVSVDRGSPARPRAVFGEIGVKHMAFLHDAPGMSFQRLRQEGLTLGLPITLLVGPDGCTLGSLSGPADWVGKDARNLIEAARKLAAASKK